jgi:hypothetical protein
MPNEDYAEQLLRNMAIGNALVERLIGEVRDSSTILGELERNVGVLQHDVSGLRKDIDDLVRIVRGEGNGTSGLTGRTVTLEHISDDLRNGIESIRENCKVHLKDLTNQRIEEARLEKTEKHQEKLEGIRGKWVVMAALCGTSSVIGVIAAIVLTKLFHLFVFK